MNLLTKIRVLRPLLHRSAAYLALVATSLVSTAQISHAEDTETVLSKFLQMMEHEQVAQQLGFLVSMEDMCGEWLITKDPELRYATLLALENYDELLERVEVQNFASYEAFLEGGSMIIDTYALARQHWPNGRRAALERACKTVAAAYAPSTFRHLD